MDSISLFSSGSAKQKPLSALERVMLIAESGRSPAEKRQMLQALQEQMEGDRVKQLMVSMNKVEVKEKKNEDQQTNEDGDTVEISQAAQMEYEQSASSSDSSSSVESSASSASSGSSSENA